MYNMNISCAQDDVGEYSQWKSFVSFTKLPRLQSEQKKKRQLAVANQLIRHANVKAAANIKVKATAKYKVPVSKEVEIINKWRELDQADRELAKTRAHYEVVYKLYKDAVYCSFWKIFGKASLTTQIVTQ